MSQEFTPTSPIDEQAAWRLIRAIRQPGPGNGAQTRVSHDPNPAVWLQVEATGQWEVSTDVSDGARDLLELYAPLQLPDELTIGQIGQSLDGRIATHTGHSHYVTGHADIMRLHRLRALVDAVIVGAGTIAADDPRLTVREVEGNNPVRVILDPDNRLKRTSRVFSDSAAPTLHVRRAETAGATDVIGMDYEVVVLPVNGEGIFDPGIVLSALRSRGLKRTLVEGGGVTVSRFLQAGVLDRLHITVAPLLIGSGRAALTLDPIDSLDAALRPPCRRFELGDDLLFDFDLRPMATEGPASEEAQDPTYRRSSLGPEGGPQSQDDAAG